MSTNKINNCSILIYIAIYFFLTMLKDSFMLEKRFDFHQFDFGKTYFVIDGRSHDESPVFKLI